LDLQLSIVLHTSVFTAGIDVLLPDSLDFEFTNTEGIVSDPDNGLRLPQGGVVKCPVVESRGVAVWCTGIGLFLIDGDIVVVDLAMARVGGGVGSGETSLVGKSVHAVTLDGVGRVSVDEVVLLESEPVDVDLENSSENDLNNLPVNR
jgi:hypothetical protein